MAISAPLTPAEKMHVNLMSEIVRNLSDTPMVLKGGTALLLAYGLDRFSEDLDFDSSKAIQLESRLRLVANRLVKVIDINVIKDTATVSRYRLRYESFEGKARLKIETSFRSKPTNYQIVEGMKVYQLPILIMQKLNALENRTKARDLYDINFLANTYPNSFSDESRYKLAQLMINIDAIEKRFMPAFQDDLILRNKDVPALILSLQEISSQYLFKQNHSKFDSKI